VTVSSLRSDLSVLSDLEFEYPPVGVKFLFSRPEDMEQLDKTLPLCQMIREAHQRTAPFYFAEENEDCFGKIALGMADIPAFAEAGLVGEKYEVFQEPRANARLYQLIAKIPRGTVNYVAFSPIDALTFEPDLVILLATPSQGEIVLRGLNYGACEVLESKITNVLTCSWIYAYPYQSGKMNYLVTGTTFGMKAKHIFPEGMMMISIPWDKIPGFVSNLKEMKWVLPGYAEGPEEFKERVARVRAECAEEAQSL
jgi:uncharacterized protein (DUF169 family)